MYVRRKVSFQKLVDRYDPYTDEQLFEIFRWMIKTGWKFRDCGRYGSSGVFEWLYGLSSTSSQNYWYTYGFNRRTWRKKIKAAFVRAIVCNDCSDTIKKWRETENIFLDKYRMLNFRISKERFNVNQGLYDLFTAHKRKLTIQLNKYHPKAINIDHILLTTNGDGWWAELHYGHECSRWNHRLAEQKNMGFGDFIKTACDNLKELTSGTKKAKGVV